VLGSNGVKEKNLDALGSSKKFRQGPISEGRLTSSPKDMKKKKVAFNRGVIAVAAGKSEYNTQRQ